VWALLPLLPVWAASAGVPCDAALRRSAARAALALPPAGRLGLTFAALGLRWLAWCDAARAECALEALQTVGWPPARGAFVLVKAVLGPVVWGRR
jgi:hypothetical protein